MIKTAENCLFGHHCVQKAEVDCSQCFNHILKKEQEEDFDNELKELPNE